MWLPKTEAEIVQAIQSGALEESAIFDAKEQLSKNSEIAKDVAAMATDGGVIIYGLGQDEHGRISRLTPISLDGQAEKIDAIVRSSIAETPVIHISTIPTEPDPAVGYLVVYVPPSERAPHMVVVKGENRFYGRTATGNYPLLEGEVARLYARRQQLEFDREKFLDMEIINSPLKPNEKYAYVYMFARPLFAREEFFEILLNNGQNIQFDLNELIQEVSSGKYYKGNFGPDFRLPSFWQRTADGFFGEMGSSIRESEVDPGSILQISVDINGTCHLFCGRAGKFLNNGRVEVFPEVLAGLSIRFITLVGKLYEKVKYLGMVDVGVAVKGLKGSVVHTNDPRLQHARTQYDRNEFRKTSRRSSLEMVENAKKLSAYLVMPLVNAMSQNSINPYR